jgi:hypothetical protein
MSLRGVINRRRQTGMKLNKLAAATGIFLTLAAAAPLVALAKHGADDPVGHVRGGHGADDARGHARHGGEHGPNHR